MAARKQNTPRAGNKYPAADEATTRTAAPVTDDQKWDLVCRRSPEADGQFYYSVSTTGIFCRPSCPSRLAKRQHVRFYDTIEAVLEAGFRPCKRCRPDRHTPAQRNAAMVANICRLIENTEIPLSLDVLARESGFSRYHFHRIFKSVTGLTPGAYQAAHRAERVREKLSDGNRITDVIYDTGFNSSGRFYENARQILGMTPGRFRDAGADTVIRFAVGESSLGSILVAATPLGVCAISLGDNPDTLLRELQDRFPRAELIGGDSEFDHIVARVVGFVEAPGTGVDLPLDIRGTVFQMRVWEALRKIPPGSTASYAEIARQIGSPRAVRAVAGACASNPIAVAIPCHRVVRSDGSLSGYRWGIERKRALLHREADVKTGESEE